MAEKKHWYENKTWVKLFLIFFYPVGLFGYIKCPNKPKITMIIMSIVIGFCILVGILPSNTTTNGSVVSDSNTETPQLDDGLGETEYIITYDGNGNTGGKAPVDNNRYPSGTLVEFKSDGTLIKDGYKFKGWNENKDADTWYDNPKIAINRDITLYAIWKEYMEEEIRDDFSDILVDDYKPSRPTQQQAVSYTVYIVSSGNRYHRSSCRTLSRSTPRPIDISVAQSRGYSACQICNP
jgi:uncharacterized repeat protein (TIGR02543 family)